MSIKLALLKSGESVISDAKELISDDKVCGYLFTKPHSVRYKTPIVLTEEKNSSRSSLEVSLSPWIIFSKDEKIPVPTDWVVTIVEPIDSLREMYEQKYNVENNQTDSIDESTTLSE